MEGRKKEGRKVDGYKVEGRKVEGLKEGGRKQGKKVEFQLKLLHLNSQEIICVVMAIASSTDALFCPVSTWMLMDILKNMNTVSFTFSEHIKKKNKSLYHRINTAVVQSCGYKVLNCCMITAMDNYMDSILISKLT